jgi:hypothetical protein
MAGAFARSISPLTQMCVDWPLTVLSTLAEVI